MMNPRSAAALLCLAAATQAFCDPAPRERVSIDSGWRFAKGDPAEVQGTLAYAKTRDWFVASGNEFLNVAATKPARPAGNLGDGVSYAQPEFDDGAWRKIDLPHDWGIEGPFRQEYDSATARLPWWGVGWYRKRFNVPASDKDRRVYLDVDGAMSYAMVWLNGQFVGGWPYGYASFQLDLTPYLKPGAENVLAIRLENPPESSRWYPGGGIYRNVWLEKTSPVHVAHWGTYVTTPRVADEAAIVDIQTTLKNPLATAVDAQVSTSLYELGPDGRQAAGAAVSGQPAPVRMAAGRLALCEQNLTLPHPKLWSLARPQRYVAVTTVSVAGAVADVVETPFGIRTIAFTADGGFLLNGVRVPIDGVCDHHDLGPLGSALNLRALERQIQMLREMGCNAIRTSHNPPAPELLDICDRLGMLVMDESFDCWMNQKRPNDYHLLFADWHEKDLRALIRRDRNHPSVILWSIGNEISEQKQPEGWRLAVHLAAIVREEDRTRPVTAAYNATESGYNGFETAVDAFGYNYKPGEYGNVHRQNPLKPVFGSETASTISTRGEYVFPVVEDKSQGHTTDHQMSSYDLYAPRWATSPDVEFKGQDLNPFVAGEFVWTGWDYLGEPTPYGNADDTARSSYFGIIDLDGFKKDRFYLYQARWRPDLPMAHLLPHWTWPDRVGQVTPVHVYTSGDEAELFLNGRSLGRKKKGPLEYRIRWDDVVYQPGELRVVAYKNGGKWAEDSERTAGPAARLALAPGRTELAADGRDLSFVTVAIEDRDGVLAPHAKNHIEFTVSGPGEIAAVDDGDPTSFEPFRASGHNAFNGLALVVVRSKAGQLGPITVEARADGLAGAKAELKAVASENPALPTVFIVGDSTAANNGNPKAVGWGVPFPVYFDPSRVNIVNRARGGRSSRTFMTEGLWDKVLGEVKPGDFVLLQFGHNDGGAINDNSRARGSLPGLGDESRDIDNLLTKKHEVVHTFGWYMRKMIDDAKGSGAHVVVLGLTVRDIWHGDIVERGPGNYSDLSAQIARAEKVPFLDLTSLIAERYEKLGQETVKGLFPQDHTHTSEAGATINATLVVAGLKALPNLLPRDDFSPAGIAIPPPPAPVRRPPPVPADAKLPSVILIGDSTVRNGFANGAGGQWGWGEPIAALFDRTRINVVNRAVGGLSSRTYLTGGFWDRALPLIKPGDVVIMQFGRNDSGAVNDNFRARASLKGNGEETQEIDNILTKKHEVVHTYGWYLRKFIADAKARGATAIVCSPTPQKVWRDGEVEYEDFARWAKQAADAGGARFVDLEAIIDSRYAEMGPEKTEEMYGDPHTHNSWEGALLNAQCVISGLKSLKEDPLAPYMSAAAASIPAYETEFASPPNPPAFWSWSRRPPMGWNSWDRFATTITEAQAKAEADAMAGLLLSHGWEYLTVDIQWYEPGAVDFNYRRGAPLTLDGWGRLLPAPNRFPSAAGEAGFKALAEYVHGKGLKFGLHLLRGIPRQAVDRNLPILGTSFRAGDVADRGSTCSWNTDMYGVDMSKPGAQAYYDSVFALLAQWGVDFVKVDDLGEPYHAVELDAIRSAIDRAGRPMVLSVSPGPTPVAEGSHVAARANLWRVSGDFWDDWQALLDQFARLNRWTPYRAAGHFPDADMLPLGTIDLGRRGTHFTPDEQRTLMTLWSIARSPLILGADLTKLDGPTISLVTNDEVLAVDRDSAANRQLFRRDGFVAWIADIPGSPDKYLALFNTRDKAGAGAGDKVPVDLAAAGFAAGCRVRDLWMKADLGVSSGQFAPEIPWHGAGLFRLSPR